MYLDDTLLACPACSCHARSSAIDCPSCGARLRNEDGSRTRTAGAVLLGLVLVAAPAVASCSGGVEVGSAQGSTGAGGAATGSTGSTGGHPVATDYGVPATTHAASSSSSSSGGFGGAQTDYGVPPTSSHAASSSSGAGGAGGH